MQSSRVFITQYNCLSVSGKNSEELFTNILAAQSGIKSDTTYFPKKCVGIGKIGEDLDKTLLVYLKELLEKSSLENFENTLLVVGSSVGGMKDSEETYFQEKNFKKLNPALHVINSISYKISKKFHFKDSISFSTACTSSANALGYAYEVISKGIYKNALVVGFDTLCKTTVGGFDSLGVLSQTICRPFDKKRNGMNVAEGFGLLLLENEPQKNGIEVCGVGYSSDAFHMTQPNPRGALQAMKNALTCKGISPKEVGYINAHGTGTIANDLSEIEAIKTLFGSLVPLSSTKSITGHTLGAAGALEAIICALTLQKQILPPNLGLDEPEVESMNYILKSQKQKLRYALSNSFAFGGNNTSILFGVYDEN